jgi:hypothetical protein
MKKFTSIFVKSHKVAYSVAINGVTIIANRDNTLPQKELGINQWVSDGTNTIDINLFIAGHFWEELEDQYLDIRIFETEVNGQDQVESTTKELHWKWEHGTEFPINLSDTFSLSLPYSGFLWDAGEPLTEETIDIEGLKDYITSINTLMDTKNYAVIEPLVTPKAKELASMYYIPVEQRLNDQRDFFHSELFSTPGWGMEKIDFERMNIEYHASGKLIEVLDRQGKPILKSKPIDDAVFSLPMFLSYQNEKWVICR